MDFIVFWWNIKCLVNISPHFFTLHLLEPESYRNVMPTPKIFTPRPPVEESYTQMFSWARPCIGLYNKDRLFDIRLSVLVFGQRILWPIIREESN